MAKTKPWLEYNGETTAELLAGKKTHRIDSILCALEWGIQGKKKKTPEERLVLSIMALDREVMNGGFDQFFRNSSREYAPVIVKSLETVGSLRTAALTARAIETLKLERVSRKAVDAAMAKKSATRDRKLGELDQEYFAFYENEKKLFAYVEKNAAHITCDGEPGPLAEKGPMNVPGLALELEFGKNPPASLRAAITRARQIATNAKMTEGEISSAAHLYFLYKLRSEQRWDEGERVIQGLIDSASDAALEVQFWVEASIDAERREAADRWATAFLQQMQASEQEPAKDEIEFWTEFVKAHAGALPVAAAFCRKAFVRGKRRE